MTEQIERGQMCVKTYGTTFGDVIKHGLDADRVLLMGLPQHHGWRAISPVCLSHQTYVEKVAEWLEDNPLARKVAVLDVDSGTWKTVWER